MLVVKVELWPFGNQDTRREVGRLHIWNTGRRDDSYGYRVYKDGEDPNIPTSDRTVVAEGEVQDFDRQSGTAYDLLRQVLDKVTDEDYESGWLERMEKLNG